MQTERDAATQLLFWISSKSNVYCTQSQNEYRVSPCRTTVTGEARAREKQTNEVLKIGETTKRAVERCVLESNITSSRFYFFLNLAFFAATTALGNFGLD